MVQQRIFLETDVAKRNNGKACWVTRNGVVYDVTSFLEDHPGGDDLILDYGGKDIGAIMKDPASHDHGSSAYEMLEEFRIGELGGHTSVDDNWVPDENFHPDDTDVNNDYKENKFLDLSKPLLAQVWNAPWSKEYYLQQVHNPRHLKDSARLFEWDVLEAFTRTKWYVIPLFWGPITVFLFGLSLLQFTDSRIVASDVLTWPLPNNLPTPGLMSWVKVLPCYILGCFIWTLLEYGLHRFLFHLDPRLPDANWAFLLHFLLHGVHHYLPMDRLRLVMPPLLFFVLETPFTRLAHILFPKAIANGIISGSFTFYILYDCTHYALHHTRLPQYIANLKRYHLAHHYKNFELGYGVTSPIWDYVFGTELW